MSDARVLGGGTLTLGADPGPPFEKAISDGHAQDSYARIVEHFRTPAARA